MSSYEEYEMIEDEEEIDLIKLVSTNANDSNQYLLFHGHDDCLYAKNVSKIEEIVVFKTLDVVKNYDDNIVLGVADVRNEMLVLINFDTWLSGQECDESDNEFVIVVSYGGEKFGLVVKNVDYIITIEAKHMYATGTGNSKSSFTTKIKINNKEQLCTIIDSDKMLFEAFEENRDKSEKEVDNLTLDDLSQKTVLLADDSKLIQRLLSKVCTKLNLNYKIFDDGQALMQEIEQSNHEDIGLVITDLEMPILGGKDVLKNIRENQKYDDLNIIVHSNMVNNVMQKELKELGANDIICKVDVDTLSHSIQANIR